MKGKKTGGRVAGTPNKVNKTLKDMILGALATAGGQAYLARQAKENPTVFLTLVGKVLPLQVGGDPSGVPIATREIRNYLVSDAEPD